MKHMNCSANTACSSKDLCSSPISTSSLGLTKKSIRRLFRMLKETDHLFFSEPLVLVLLYTSFCGTCEMAKRMLAVLSQTVKDVAFYQMNANLHPAVLKQYDVRSIPCFLIFKN